MTLMQIWNKRMNIKNLLENDFSSYYNIPKVNIDNFKNELKESYFEIEDINCKIKIYTDKNTGTARYSNPHEYTVCIIFYEEFFNVLDKSFQFEKRKCDVIIATIDNKKYFLLNELKNRKWNQNEEAKIDAIDQLVQTLHILISVPSMSAYIESFTVKQCCYFNKQTPPPSPELSVIAAFNRLERLSPEYGFEMEITPIKAAGFSYYERFGGQIYNLL